MHTKWLCLFSLSLSLLLSFFLAYSISVSLSLIFWVLGYYECQLASLVFPSLLTDSLLKPETRKRRRGEQGEMRDKIKAIFLPLPAQIQAHLYIRVCIALSQYLSSFMCQCISQRVYLPSVMSAIRSRKQYFEIYLTELIAANYCASSLRLSFLSFLNVCFFQSLRFVPLKSFLLSLHVSSFLCQFEFSLISSTSSALSPSIPSLVFLWHPPPPRPPPYLSPSNKN